MKRSSLVLVITLLASAALSLIIYKYLKLIMTLPLIICGAALLFSQKYHKNAICGKLSINLGIVLSTIGIIFSALNLIILSSEKKTLIKHEGDYGREGGWRVGNQAQGLGYSYPPNLKNYSSKMVVQHSDSRKETVYDVTYNTDSLANRRTPYLKKDEPNKSNSILFLGDSFTFGEGLNDDETLSFFIQNETGRSTLNAGMHGYGAHQALRILEDQNLYNKRTKGHNVKTIIYRIIVGHINRTAGYSPWDMYGPCYELTGSRTVSYKGSFIECAKKNGYLDKVLNRLASTSEPFTKQVFKRFTTIGRYANNNYLQEDVDRFVAVVSRMSSIAKSKGANFFVVLEDVETYGELCGQKVPFSHELEGRFKQQRLSLILTSSVYSKVLCSSNELAIKHDGHPTMFANKLLAKYMINNNLIR